ncbi:MAG: hypothetical protein ACPGGK_18395 [Pikeienuella sp.]
MQSKQMLTPRHCWRHRRNRHIHRSINIGKTNAGRVWDELSCHEWAKAIQFGYWFALAMYPLFGLLVWGGIVDFRQAFASMGALAGGVSLLYFALLDIRGR